MNLHEYQAKQLFAGYGIPVLPGKAASSPEEAVDVARELGGEEWVVKAQIYAGGRGKAGGVQRIKGLERLKETVARLLSEPLKTPQTGKKGLPVNTVLVERTATVARELYLGVLVDRSRERVTFIASDAGGMEIEEVAAESPEKIITIAVDPVVGLQPYQCRRVGFALQLEMDQIKVLTRIMSGLYRLFLEKDASLLEINPLSVTDTGELLALDAKMNVDDNALYRQQPLAALHDETQEDPRELEARRYGLNYVALDGSIGCMVNGAGLAMATMDLITLAGGEPANFLDVGGGTTADKVAEAFKLILSDHKVKAILVNIFGGIVRCDLIAEGVITAVKEVGIDIPVVVRLEGTNAEQGRRLLEESGLSIVPAQQLSEAARKVVQMAGGRL